MLIVGLGNPGEEYARTRHNIGFMVVDRLAERWGVKLKKERKFLGWLGKGKAHLLKPATYMNESGLAARKVADYLHLDEVLVITDDAELPFGQLRLRPKGSSGGHNGLKSIARELGTTEYPRLRVGVGRQGELRNHVLGRFSAEEEKELESLIDRAADVVERLMCEPIEKVMMQANERIKE